MEGKQHIQSKVAPGGLPTHAYKPLPDEAIRRIHEASLLVLERTGIEVAASPARDIFERAGARIDPERNRVYISRAMVEDAVAAASHRFILAGRDPTNDIEMGGERVYMGTGGAAVKVMDLDGTVRSSRLDDIALIARLIDALDNIHFYQSPVIARNVPAAQHDVNQAFAALTNTTKHVMANANSVPTARDTVELAAMVAGSKSALDARPILSFVVSWVISPLRYEAKATDILIELVRQGVPVALSSAPQSGMTAPMALAGTLVQINAEELSGLVLCNLIRPGARVLLGYVPSVADMRTGSFVGGAAEFALMNAAATQLAHFYDIPIYNSAGIADSKLPDVQAGYEKAISSTTVALAGSNFVHHSAGLLESLLCVAYEQYVIDDELNGNVMRMVRGIEVNDETLSVDVIDEVCRENGHYLMTRQSLDLMRSEFYYPHTADRTSRDNWEASGALDMRERARERVREILATHQPTRIDPAVDQAIRERFDILLTPALSGIMPPDLRRPAFSPPDRPKTA